MTFSKFDHGFLHHERHADLTAPALLLHMCGIMHASEHLTDGRVPKARSLRGAIAGHLVADGHDIDDLATELVAAGLWNDCDDRWEIVGYLEHNNSKSKVDALRDANRTRQAKHRAKKSDLSSLSKTDTDTETAAMDDSVVSHTVTEALPNESKPAETLASLRSARGAA